MYIPKYQDLMFGLNEAKRKLNIQHEVIMDGENDKEKQIDD